MKVTPLHTALLWALFWGTEWVWSSNTPPAPNNAPPPPPGTLPVDAVVLLLLFGLSAVGLAAVFLRKKNLKSA